MATTPERLKIGLVLDTSLDPADGVQQYVVAIGEWLSSQGHEVHYLVGQTDKRQLANIHGLARNINVRFNGNRTTIPLPAGRKKLKQLIARQKFDVLHVQTPHHPLMAQHLILAADDSTAVVGTFHILPYGRLPRVGNRALGIWLRPSLKRFDRIVSVSPVAAEFARASFKVKTDVLPNVVDYQRFASAKPLPQYNDNRLTILFLGRLVPRKGCHTLLKAVAELAKQSRLPAFRVVICGIGPLEAKLRGFTNKHGLQDMVEFAGFVSEEDKPRYYASADISVFPSSGGESFGIVLLEAMASGRAAVLAGDNPGYRSVMEPHSDLLFDPANAGLLAQKIALYMTDDAERQAMGRWGAQYTADFDVAKIGSKLVDIYQQALRKRRGL
ncbi:glycosyltransferase family 1 protein [Candidatus Saccharibacteria bacterium CG_4_10_14_0_2_um_filter_52_9]|nr:MAG: glycosyltransferase family 1 protein [Candidatus Saccharibacteria bacterium CG_4_10_14_0_2_um_filter_52_9]